MCACVHFVKSGFVFETEVKFRSWCSVQTSCVIAVQLCLPMTTARVAWLQLQLHFAVQGSKFVEIGRECEAYLGQLRSGAWLDRPGPRPRWRICVPRHTVQEHMDADGSHVRELMESLPSLTVGCDALYDVIIPDSVSNSYLKVARYFFRKSRFCLSRHYAWCCGAFSPFFKWEMRHEIIAMIHSRAPE